ncbi:carbohydrate ABC transporter permease [Blautia schinkii]|nr:carbohydrate ABC transporter permease [Blautia schinkii]
MKHTTARRTLGTGMKRLLIALVVLIDVYPLFWMLTASFKQPAEFVEKPAYALNAGFYLQNYVDAWTRGKMAIFFRNSLINTVVSLVFIIFFTVTISFALTKMQWKGKEFFKKYFAFGIMIPVATSLIPLFQIFQKMSLINTRSCLILVYVASAISFSIYLITGSMISLPDEIMEAAVIDGCGIYNLMAKVVVPLTKNSIITVLVIQFFFKWNDLLYSMTFVSSTELKTIQTGLLYFQDEFGSKNWGAIFASVSICVVPMLLMYLVLNKKVIEGMTAGAVKG